MRQKSETRQTGAAKAIKDIRRATRKQYSAEAKIRIVLDGLRGEETIAELCRDRVVVFIIAMTRR
jgi:transposase